MTTLRDAATQALEALESLFNWQVDPERGQRCADAITALKAALAEPVQEPRLRYDGLYEYAAKHGLDYNKLCSVVRAALAEPVQEPTDWEAVAADQAMTIALMKAEPVQKPVAWIYEFYADMGHKGLAFEEQPSAYNTPLYTAPPRRKPLMEEEIKCVTSAERDSLLDHIYEYGTAAEGVLERINKLARAIERAHGIGENT